MRNHLLFIASLLLLTTACGVKAPPVPPEYVQPPAVTDLSAEVTDEMIRLSWTIPQATGKEPPLTGFYVLRSKTRMTVTECPTCPVGYEKIADLPIRKSDRETGQIRYSEVREGEFRYLYKVTGYSANGGESRASKVVRIENEANDG